MLSVGSIAPNPYQPRREFAEEDLADLAASLRENGLLQPIVVRPAPDGGGARWELVAGERRWRAGMRLGWKEIPAVVRDVDDRTLLVLALVENLQRAALARWRRRRDTSAWPRSSR
jgi:ParB family transcriptional regulator, chromosome partitioning protein